MCTFFKKRSFLFWIIVALVFVLILLFLFGFRITYSPSLENSWTAIDVVSSWVSALGAIATIAVAIIDANGDHFKELIFLRSKIILAN